MARAESSSATAIGVGLGARLGRGQADPLRPDPRLVHDLRRVGVAEQGQQLLGVQSRWRPVRRCTIWDTRRSRSSATARVALALGWSGQTGRDADQVGQRTQAPPLAVGRAPHRQHAGTADVRPVEPGGEPTGLGGEPGLPEARLGGEDEHMGLAAVDDLGQPARHERHLRLAADERPLVAQARPGAGRVERTEQLVRLDRLALALEPQRQQPPPRQPRAGSRRSSRRRRRHCRPRPRRPAGRPCSRCRR